VNVLGVVMNRVPRGSTHYYGGYEYFSNGHHEEVEEEDLKPHPQ
jgi:hypothetical protein